MIRYSNELKHYGVKGMKWGVRRTPVELGHVTKSTMSGHESTPKKSTANSIMDHVNHAGIIDVRTFYNKDGKKYKDIHTTDHGHRKQHNYGLNGEHVVMYRWNEDGTLRNKTRRELSDKERKENGDIL